MTNEILISTVETMLADIISPNPDMFLVEIKIKPTNNIKVFIDADSGVSIEKCITVNRALYKKMEETGMFPGGDFSLEVSSPGLGEPLKLFRQYKKNIGRNAEVITKDGQRKEGKLIEVTEDGFIVEEIKGKNKKKEVINHTFLFDHIKTTKIQAVF
ncbi:MAG: ribosome maturation factor [Sphingobacteriales bacterium]|nr:ribosome maturation factor [Sphingobacteriales bacterium]